MRERSFRTIWSASVLSNLGQLIQGVGAAWEMTHLTSSPGMVALVQSAMMLPLMLVAVPAGAIADMFDRRRIALTGLGFASCCAMTLAVLAWMGLTTPWVLLLFCSLIGGGVAMFGPAWQASVAEQVRPEQLPAAVALNSVSYNIARSFGPAVGGMIVLMAGAAAAFALNALLYLPLIAAFYFWRREHVPSRLPPEKIGRAIISGARYAMHSPPIRNVALRAFVFGLSSASVAALTPLVARDVLHGDHRTYGLLLGAFGVGAVAGALLIGRLREQVEAEHAILACSLAAGLMALVMGYSPSLPLTVAAMMVAGAAYMLFISMLNVGVQLSTPRWVAARALAWFQSALTGGIALGAWLYGHIAGEWGIGTAFAVSAAALVVAPLLGRLLPMPVLSRAEVEPVSLNSEPEVVLPVTVRSGPIVVEIEYRVDPAEARRYYEVMLQLQSVRLRNGGFDWSVSRDIADPELWTERYHCPTWGDYLRQRSRFTQGDRELQRLADAFHHPGNGPRVRRRLERPFGSVRWQPDSPDPQNEAFRVFTP